MITAYAAVKIHCEKNSLPFPSKTYISRIGAFLSTHFKKFWGIHQPPEIISQAGFLFSEDGGRMMLVNGYPDCFLPEMLARIDVFYEEIKIAQLAEQQKNQKKPEKVTKEVTVEKRKRARIEPKGREKVRSAKPSNPLL